MTLTDTAAKFLKKRLVSSITLTQKRWGNISLKVSFAEDGEVFSNFGRSGFVTILDELVTRKKLGLIKTKKFALHWVYDSKVRNFSQQYGIALINRTTGMQQSFPDLHRSMLGMCFAESRRGEPFEFELIEDRPKHEISQFITMVEFIVN